MAAAPWDRQPPGGALATQDHAAPCGIDCSGAQCYLRRALFRSPDNDGRQPYQQRVAAVDRKRSSVANSFNPNVHYRTSRQPTSKAAVQLSGQQAKAYARMGLAEEVHEALEKGRALLDKLPYPDRPEHHFVVDPDKWDFYVMDTYRIVGSDELAKRNAEEVIQRNVNTEGVLVAPMRNAEALTLGVIAARQGDVEEATAFEENRRGSSYVSGCSAWLSWAMNWRRWSLVRPRRGCTGRSRSTRRRLPKLPAPMSTSASGRIGCRSAAGTVRHGSARAQ